MGHCAFKAVLAVRGGGVTGHLPLYRPSAPYSTWRKVAVEGESGGRTAWSARLSLLQCR